MGSEILQFIWEKKTKRYSASADVFLNSCNGWLSFCHSILPMLEDLSKQLVVQATDDIKYITNWWPAERRHLPPLQMTLITDPPTPNPAFLPPTFHAYPPYPQHNQQPHLAYHTLSYQATAKHNLPVYQYFSDVQLWHMISGWEMLSFQMNPILHGHINVRHAHS